MPLTDRYAAAPDVLLTELDATEAVLLHTRSREYFSLNETGLRIWRSLTTRHTPEETAVSLQVEYEIETADALTHVQAFIRDVEAAGLLVRGDAP
jgi:hypothetical protein